MKRKQFTLLIVLFALGLLRGITTQAQTTLSWTYSGGPVTWTVPAGVTSITFDVQGGKGENSGDGRGTGGNGGRVQGTLAVTPGAVLDIYVGGIIADGTYPSTGGYNGGGAGDGMGTGGGGGASDIRIGDTALANRVIVAGGGGGAGEDAPDSQDGGAGGGLTGQEGINSDFSAAAGDGGTQTAGGAGGNAGWAPGAPSGTLGQGGNGSAEYEGGGGGGGYYGGGGGFFAGGGGGSSYTDPTLATSVVHTQGYNTGSGFVSITYSVGCSAGTITGPSSVCNGSSIALADTATGGAWSSSDAAIATVSATGSVTAISAGTLSIVYSVTGCATTASVTVTPVPGAGVVTGPSSVCTDSSISLADTATGGTWSSSNAAIATVSTMGGVTAISGGIVNIIYSVTGTDGCTATATASVTVSPLVNPVITFMAPVLSVANTYTTYQWYLNGNPVTGATSYTTTATADGSYSVKVTNSNGCSGTSSAYSVSGLAVQSVNMASVSIYPNPVTNVVHIASSVNVRTVISDMQGRAVIDAADTKDIDVSKLAAGIYVIVLYDENGQQLQVQKLIKQAN